MAAMTRPLTCALLLLLWGSSLDAAAQDVAARTLDGRPVRSLAGAGVSTVVLFFVASDCPVSNRTFPEMKRVREEFSGRGARFWFVYPNVGETAEIVRAHQSGYDDGGEVLLDPEGRLTRLAGAKVTPEVAVLARGPGQGGWSPVYIGRVDDRYVRIGLERPQATEHFAERVVREVLEHRPVERSTGAPVGCGIIRPKDVR